MNRIKMKKKLSAIGLGLSLMFMMGSPVFAASSSSANNPIPTSPPSLGVTTASAQAIATQAGQVIQFLDNTIHLATIQAFIVVAIIALVIKGAVSASRQQNTQKMWTEIAFGVVGIVLVINPVILIEAAIWVGGLF